MSSLHETQIGKTRRIAGYTLSIMPSLMILMAGVMKIIGATEMQANFAKFNFEFDTCSTNGLGIYSLYK